ncbi:MAG: hypothetical protein RLZZ252_846 [Bacteroidota bacterium]
MVKRSRINYRFCILFATVIFGLLNEISAQQIGSKDTTTKVTETRDELLSVDIAANADDFQIGSDSMPQTVVKENEFGYKSWYIPYSLRVSASVQVYTGSNVLPQALLNKIVFGGYMDPEIIGKAEGRLKPNNRLGFEQYNDLGLTYNANGSEYYGSGYRTNKESLGSLEIVTRENSNKMMTWADRGLLISGDNKRVKAGTNVPNNPSDGSQKKKISVWMGLNYSVLAGARFTDDAYRALLRGNGYYLGKRLDIGNNRFKEFGYLGADFVFWSNGENRNSFKSKTSRIPITWMVSLRNLSSFQLLRTDGLVLFTSSTADSLSLDGRFYQVGLKGGSVNPGITIGFNKFMLIGNGSEGYPRAPVNFSLEDFGFYYLQNANVLSRGYAWDANGRGFSPSSESSTLPVYLKQASVTAGNLQLGNWFTQQVDTAETRLRVVEQVRSGWIMSPFKVSIKTAVFTLSYRNLPGMMPVFSVYPGLRTRQVYRFFAEVFNLKKEYLRKELSSNSKVYTGFSVGGFDKVNWRLGYETDYLWLGKAVRFRADIVGVEALLAPKTYHGFGFNLSTLALF